MLNRLSSQPRSFRISVSRDARARADTGASEDYPAIVAIKKR